MRKPIDLDSELKVLADKAKQLKERQVRQLGELVVATSADTVDAEVLAGALLAVKGNSDMIRQEEWRASGAAFFQARTRVARRRARAEPKGGAEREGGGASA